MQGGRKLLRFGLGLAFVAGLAASQGCQAIRAVYIYGLDRINDAGDMADVGVSVSGKRCLSVYACGAGLFTVGAGHFDGYFVGLGGGSLGIKRHYHDAIGLVLYSYERFAWGDFDITRPETLNERHVGLIGWLFFPRSARSGGPS